MQHKDKKYNFTDVLLKMKDMAAEAVRATFLKLETTNREFNFEVKFLKNSDLWIRLYAGLKSETLVDRSQH